MLKFKNYIIKTDRYGYLKNHTDWNKDLALLLADQERIILTDEHWIIINFVRNFYKQYNSIPALRLTIKMISEKYGKEKNNSYYFYSLFPINPMRQISKIAGLPKPVKCI
ncbi:Sulfurtransferase TusE [Candidatus Ecksteinia adelgidicola]|nr:Sulfurtransferase TusE [Candidatus Ecksteinia adelgidicola]